MISIKKKKWGGGQLISDRFIRCFVSCFLQNMGVVMRGWWSYRQGWTSVCLTALLERSKPIKIKITFFFLMEWKIYFATEKRLVTLCRNSGIKASEKKVLHHVETFSLCSKFVFLLFRGTTRFACPTNEWDELRFLPRNSVTSVCNRE